MSDINTNINNYSTTERLNQYIGNGIWREGYTDVVNGNLRYDTSGKLDFNNLSTYASLWTFVSASFEDVGNLIYDKINNYIRNVRDIETCELHSLKSMATELNVENIIAFDYDYPIEIGKLIYIFSIPYSRLILSGATSFLDSTSISRIYENSINLTNTLDGYNISGNIFNSQTNPAGIWTETQVSNIQFLSGNLPLIQQNDYINFIEQELSSCLLAYITKDGIINDIKYSIDTGEISSDEATDAPADSDEINALKIQYNIDKIFHANAEADKVQRGTALLSDYRDNEQLIITEVLNSRIYNKDKFGNDINTFRANKYDRQRKVREYINFVENIYFQNSQYTAGLNYNETLGSSPSFFDYDSNGNLLSGIMIDTAVHILRNSCLKISYLREYLRRIAQKHAIIGTERIIQTVISEYLAKELTSPEYWGYYNFSGIQTPSILDIPVIHELSSGMLGDIKVIEYWDNTEYMNISACTDIDYVSGNVNFRYWENDNALISKITSEHTDAEISSFYKNVGFKTKSWDQIKSELNTIYDMGAVSATQYPTFINVPYSLAMSGTIGDYGRYIVEDNFDDTYTTYISADIIPSGIFANTEYYDAWTTSKLITSYLATSAFLDKWAETPFASAWIYDLQFDTQTYPGDVLVTNTNFVYDNLDSVSAWIKTNYNTTSWVANENTTIWYQSPLIQIWDMDQFISVWDRSYKVWGNAAISSFWQEVTYMQNDISGLGWNALNDVRDYAISLRHYAGVSDITQAEWISSDFVFPFNAGNPFDIGLTNISFDPNTQWALSSNPFVSGWLLGDPYVPVYSNMDEITANTLFNANLLTTTEYLYNLGYISGPDGQLTRNISPIVSGGITDGSLSGMFYKYLSDPNGTFPPANIKNTVHPSIAYQPFLYNLKQIIRTRFALENVYRLFTIPINNNTSDYLIKAINEYGSTINHWRNINLDYSGYQTFYEFSNNLNLDKNEDYRIDQDGPWHPDALSAFLTDPSHFKNDLSPYYGHLKLTTTQENVIKNQLTIFENNIKDMSDKKIYQYGVDKYQNHYTLYKDSDDFDVSGQLWMRYHNHPISFPFYTNSYTNSISSYLNQVFNNNTVLSNIRDLEYISNNCLDFGFVNAGNENIIWLYGQDNHISGSVNLSGALYIMTLNNSTNVPSMEIDKLKGNFYRMYFKNEKYIGIYNNLNGFIITSLLDSNLISEINGTYTAQLKFRPYNIESGFKFIPTQNIKNLKYNEYYAGDNHNQWKLTASDNVLTIAFESCSGSIDSLSSLFYSYNGVNKYDPTLNDCTKNLYDNNITLIEAAITDTKPYITNNSYGISYYSGYSNLTYIGINAFNGFDNTLGYYGISSGDILKLQYFGNPDTDAQIGLNFYDNLHFFNNSNNNLGVYGTNFAPSWNSLSSTVWLNASASWLFREDGSYIFTYPEETFIWSTTSLGIDPTYVITYKGNGCHLFTIEQISGFYNDAVLHYNSPSGEIYGEIDPIIYLDDGSELGIDWIPTI
jgi:hypothetical protein